MEDLDASDPRMTGVDLTEARSRNVEFSRAALNIARADFAILENLSFESADLDGARFRGARLINESFAHAELRAAVFDDATFVTTDLPPGQR